MKKIYLLVCLIAVSFSSFAQTFPNAGFETWRTSTSGLTAAVTVHAPDQWFGFDSLIIADGEAYAIILGAGTYYAQLFQETTPAHVHGGSSSAQLITLNQGALGLIPGTLSNSAPAINAAAVIASMGANIQNDITFSGGTAVSERIQSVSAWVQYFPGVDSAGAPAQDTGIMTVEAISFIGGRDSIVGLGTFKINPTATFTQITDSITYTDMVDAVDTIRVTFASSGGAATTMDSSTLYVDDVTMTAVVNDAVKSIPMSSDLVKVYPNPANNTINMDCPQSADLSCKLYAVNGQVVLSSQLAATNELNISDLPSGLYFYAIADNKGNIIQKGKVTIAK